MMGFWWKNDGEKKPLISIRYQIREPDSFKEEPSHRVPGIYYWNADPLKKRKIVKNLGGVIIRQPTLLL